MKIICFEEQYKDNELVNKVLKGLQLRFTIEDVLELFSKSKEELIKLFNGTRNDMYKGILKDIYLYYILEYINKEKLLQNNNLSSVVRKNIEMAKRFEFIDYSYIYHVKSNSINALSKINSYSNFDYKLSIYFEEQILNSIPSNYNKLERVFYIYLKLCNLLKYNEEYFIKHHSNRDYPVGTANLEKVINGESNEVVCFEFCNLFSYFMIKEGNFVSTNYVDSFGQNDMHDDSFVVVDHYLLKVDSTISVFFGDLTNVKFGKPVNGFKLSSENKKDLYNFNVMMEKVYNEFKKNNRLPNNSVDMYNKLKLMINSINNNSIELSEEVKKRVINYLSHLYEYHTSKMDFISNSFYTKYDVLNIDEQNIKMTIISKQKLDNEATSVIISIKTDNNGYYYLELESDNFEFISKEELEQKLENQEYKLLNEGRCRPFITIPGIGYYDGKRRVLEQKKD